MDTVFSVASFLYTRTGNVLSQKPEVCDSVKWIVLLPVRRSKSVVCSRGVTSQDGCRIVLLLHITPHALRSAELPLPAIHSGLLRTAQGRKQELSFVIFTGRKTRFRHVSTLPKNRYAYSHHKPTRPIVQFPASDA